MKRILKILILGSMFTFIFTGCSKNDELIVEDINNSQLETEINNDDNNIEESNEISKKDNTIFISEDGSGNGLLSMGMSLDEVLDVISSEKFDIIKEEKVDYIFDEQGVGTLDENAWNFDKDNVQYTLELKGDIVLVFDENKVLTNIVLEHSFEALEKEVVTKFMNNGENLSLYDGTYSTDKGLNLSSNVEDIVELYGEPENGIYKTDGTDYYMYKLNDELYLNVIVSGSARDFIQRIEYSNVAPIEFSN